MTMIRFKICIFFVSSAKLYWWSIKCHNNMMICIRGLTALLKGSAICPSVTGGLRYTISSFEPYVRLSTFIKWNISEALSTWSWTHWASFLILPPHKEINAKVIHLFISKVKFHCLSWFVNWLINDCLSHYFRAYKIRWNSDLDTFPAVNRPSLWSSVFADRLHWLDGRLNQSWELQCSYLNWNSRVMFWWKKDHRSNACFSMLFRMT